MAVETIAGVGEGGEIRPLWGVRHIFVGRSLTHFLVLVDSTRG